MERVKVENVDSNKRNRWNWTNEKHSNYLSLMEANFIRNVLVERNNSMGTTIDPKYVHETRLDRFVPDMSDSTHDLQPRKLYKPAHRGSSKRHTPLAQPSLFSRGQVVPHTVDNGEKEQSNSANDGTLA